MKKLESITEKFFENYEFDISSAKYYRLKERWLTVYCGFYSVKEDSTFILRYRDKLEVYFENKKVNIEQAICSIEGKSSISDFTMINQNIDGFESGKFFGA